MYPNPNPNNSPYPPQPQPNVGWPSTTGSASPYPPAPGYPGAAPGYPVASPGYPPTNSSPYPQTTPGYPSPQPSYGSYDSSFGSSPYAGSSPGYPPQTTPGYPPQQQPSPAYPGASPGYPGTSPGYPQVSPAAPSPYGAPGGTPGYPATSSPYSTQQTSSPYPAQQTNSPYPTQQQPGGYGAPGYPPSPLHTGSSPYGAPPPPGGITQTQAPSYYNAPQPGHGQGHGSAPSAYPGAPPTSGHPGMQQYQEVPTVRPVQHDAAADAGVLRKAMKGFGTDEQAIIQVLGRRTNAQRLEIARAFKASFGKDLIKDLKSELGGKLEDVVVALMTPRFDYIAEHVHKGISGLGTKEKSLVDVLCTASNQEMYYINQAYHRLYNTTLERDLKGDTSGHFRRLLVAVTVGGRDENPVANPQRAAEDAKALYDAGVKKFGTDEAAFNQILCTRSYAQLRLMFHEYEKTYGMAFETAIDREFSGDVKTGLMAVVKCAKNRAAYFAERIHESVAGMGTKDDDLIFLIVTRAEVDLESVKQEYHRMYHKSMAADVGGDTSGDYKKILMALLGN